MKKTGKYKVGERVVFLSGVEMRQLYERSGSYQIYGGFNSKMELYGGMVVTVRKVIYDDDDENSAYYMKEENMGSFVWDERFIEGPYMKKVELPEGLFEL